MYPCKKFIFGLFGLLFMLTARPSLFAQTFPAPGFDVQEEEWSTINKHCFFISISYYIPEYKGFLGLPNTAEYLKKWQDWRTDIYPRIQSFSDDSRFFRGVVIQAAYDSLKLCQTEADNNIRTAHSIKRFNDAKLLLTNTTIFLLQTSEACSQIFSKFTEWNTEIDRSFLRSTNPPNRIKSVVIRVDNSLQKIQGKLKAINADLNNSLVSINNLDYENPAFEFMLEASRKSWLIWRNEIITLTSHNVPDVQKRFLSGEWYDAYEEVNGWTVVKIEFAGQSNRSGATRVNGGKILGTIRLDGPKKWVQTDLTGKVEFTYTETNRDDWSVYLFDPSRNANLQIDLHTRNITLSSASETKIINQVINSSAHPIGPSPVRALFGNNFFRIDPELSKLSNFRIWVHDNAVEKGKFGFVETHRDDWSIYLVDHNNHINVQIDLHRKEISVNHTTEGRTEVFALRHADFD